MSRQHKAPKWRLVKTYRDITACCSALKLSHDMQDSLLYAQKRAHDTRHDYSTWVDSINDHRWSCMEDTLNNKSCVACGAIEKFRFSPRDISVRHMALVSDDGNGSHLTEPRKVVRKPHGRVILDHTLGEPHGMAVIRKGNN